MKTFIKNNLALVVGVSLPVLLIVVFALATVVPAAFIDPPKYDALFVTHQYGQDGWATVNVVNNAVLIKVNVNARRHDYQEPRLYHFNAATQKTKRIDISYPDPGEDDDKGPKWENIAVPQLEKLKLRRSRVAPDGYLFELYHNGRGGLMSDLFFGGRYRSVPSLVKNGNRVSLQDAVGEGYYYNARLLGWVVGQEGD